MTSWPEMMRAASAMGIAPEAFWKLSVREWRWLTMPPGEAGPLGRAGLDEMMRRWPDG